MSIKSSIVYLQHQGPRSFPSPSPLLHTLLRVAAGIPNSLSHGTLPPPSCLLFLVFPVLPHALFISCSSSLSFLSTSISISLFFYFSPFLWVICPSCSHYVSLTFVNVKQSPRRMELQHGSHLAYLNLCIARSSRAKGRISQRDDATVGCARRVEGGRIVHRKWRGANRVGVASRRRSCGRERTGLWSASGLLERANEREKL